MPQPSWQSHAVSAIVVGLLAVFFVYFAGAVLRIGGWFRVDLPEVCSTWNQHNIMEWTVFLAGVLGYLTVGVALSNTRVSWM